MTKFILHGGYTGIENESNAGFFKELSRDVPQNGTILVVCFASGEGTALQRFEEDKKRIIDQSDGKAIDIQMATETGFHEQAAAADCIYLRGGNTRRLFDALRRAGISKELIEGKTVAGCSAGAYALAAFYYSNSEAAVFEGFGYLPVRVVCHYQSATHPLNGDPEKALEAYSKDFELVILRDSEWRVF